MAEFLAVPLLKYLLKSMGKVSYVNKHVTELLENYPPERADQLLNLSAAKAGLKDIYAAYAGGDTRPETVEAMLHLVFMIKAVTQWHEDPQKFQEMFKGHCPNLSSYDKDKWQLEMASCFFYDTGKGKLVNALIKKTSTAADIAEKLAGADSDILAALAQNPEPWFEGVVTLLELL